MKIHLLATALAFGLASQSMAAIVNYDFSFVANDQSQSDSTAPLLVTGTLYGVEDDVGFGNGSTIDQILIHSSPFGAFEIDATGQGVQTIGGEVANIIIDGFFSPPGIYFLIVGENLLSGNPILDVAIANGPLDDPATTSYGNGASGGSNLTFTAVPISQVPLPATLPLLFAAVGVFASVKRRRTKIV